MGALDSILIPSLRMEEILSDGSTLTNPAADSRRLFLGEDGYLHLKDSAGTVTDPIAAGSGIAATIFDAKGDLIVATAADTAARKAAGTNGYMLTAQSGQSDGLLWAIAPTFHGVKAYKTSQSVTDAVLAFDTEEFDTDAYHDNVTNNSRLTVPSGLGGYYGVMASSYISGSGRLEIYKNGAIVRSKTFTIGAAGNVNAFTTVSLVATDYIEIFGNAGGARTYGDAGTAGDNTTVSMWLLGI